MDQVPEYVYHIAQVEEWDAAVVKRAYTHQSLKDEGFIHCSTKDQVVATANRFFKGKKNLVLLQIATSQITSKLQMDHVEDINQSFPHIYGHLNIDAVTNHFKFNPNSEGQFSLPVELE